MAFFVPILAIVAANVGANLMQLQEDQRAEERAREAADQQRREEEARIVQQAREAERAAEAARQIQQQRIQHERDQLGLVKSILDFSSSGAIEHIPACLKRLDHSYFRSLGQRPLAAAKDEEALNAIDQMLRDETRRREGPGCLMGPKIRCDRA